MIEIALAAFFSYRNTMLARQKGQNALVWVLITIAAFFICMFAGLLIVIGMSYRGAMTPGGLLHFFTDNILRMITVYVIASGGGLLVGYILDRMPDKKPE